MRGKQRKVQCWRGQFGIGLLLLGSQTDEVFGLERLYRFKLLRQRKVRARRSVSINDAFRQQVRNSLAFLGNVRTENVIERAVLTNENNNVLNRRLGFDLRSFAAFYRLGFLPSPNALKLLVKIANSDANSANRCQLFSVEVQYMLCSYVPFISVLQGGSSLDNR